MKKYRACYRVNAESEWSDGFYTATYIEAENEDVALEIAKEYVIYLGYDADCYDWMVCEYED